MFKLEPFVSEKIWGYERWIVSTHKVGQSVVSSNTNKLGDFIKCDFPLLIKVIQANDTLSVQVHPNDEYARIHENTFGKTECWYVLDAVPNATLVCGLNRDYTTEELRIAITNNKLESCLRNVPVSKGDFIFIPAGTVHAINGGLRLLEVQEPSDITYRLYDWGRGREIHVEKGLEVTKSDAPDPIKKFEGKFGCDFFELEKINVSGSTEITVLNRVNPDTTVACGENKKSETANVCDWLAIFVISGSGTIKSDGCPFNKGFGELSTDVKAEDTFLVHDNEKLYVTGNMSLMIMKK